MTFEILNILEPVLDSVFEKFYQSMLSNRDFAVFFKDDDHIRSLIEKQKMHFLDSLNDSEEELKARYSRLGEIHYNLRLPYVDFFAAMGMLEEGLLLSIASHHDSKDLMRTAFKFFRLIRAYTAKGYLNKTLEADSADIDRYLENVHRSSEIDTQFATERIIWLKNLTFAIQIENRAAAPSFQLPTQVMDSIQSYAPEDPDLVRYINDTIARIEINAANVFYFLEKKNYEEVLTLYRELMQIYKLSLMLTNVITIAASSAIISSLSKDDLTGMLGRNSLNDIIEREFSLATASGYEISLIMMDLDHFKNVNDTYGHAAGDEVLKTTSKFVHDNIRATDFSFRMGGEEFLIILKGASLKVASRQAELIRKEIEEHAFKYDGKTFRITASFGVSTYFSPFQMGLQSMLKQVDLKLYESKRNGRNRVTW
ncbi:MAG: GGDEF domain-containing protein [Desulfobacteraceae bacterium]|nr:MAG: GGDEF domain-containing protein [Desulfobacteraceae bacterium]